MNSDTCGSTAKLAMEELIGTLRGLLKYLAGNELVLRPNWKLIEQVRPWPNVKQYLEIDNESFYEHASRALEVMYIYSLWVIKRQRGWST